MKLKIIIGEQDFDVYEQMREYLSRRGHKVAWAGNGPDTIRMADEARADLVFVDALAPELSGLKVCRQVKAKNPEKVKTIIISPVFRQTPADVSESGAADVDAFIEKPINLNQLNRVLTGLYPDLDPRAKVNDVKLEPVDKKDHDPTARKIGLEGSLADVPLPKLLFHFHRLKRTGVLILRREKIVKKIFLRKGQPVFVASGAASETLGRFLLRQGRISMEQYGVVLEEMLVSHKQQGIVLIEKKLLSPHELYESMKGLTSEKILRTFAWETGAYSFQRGKFKIAEENLTPLAVLPLILEGIRTHYHLVRLEAFFVRYKRHVPRKLKPEQIEQGTAVLKITERKLMSMIDGNRPIGSLVTNSPLNLTETFQILFYLIVVECIQLYGIRPPSARARNRARLAQEARTRQMVEFQGMLDRTYRILNNLDLFQVLGLSRKSTQTQIRSAYITMTRQFRPFDLYNASPPIVKEKADRIFDRLSLAYETLLDREKRAEYIKELNAAGKAEQMEQEMLHRLAEQTPSPVSQPIEPEIEPTDSDELDELDEPLELAADESIEPDEPLELAADSLPADELVEPVEAVEPIEIDEPVEPLELTADSLPVDELVEPVEAVEPVEFDEPLELAVDEPVEPVEEISEPEDSLPKFEEVPLAESEIEDSDIELRKLLQEQSQSTDDDLTFDEDDAGFDDSILAPPEPEADHTPDLEDLSDDELEFDLFEIGMEPPGEGYEIEPEDIWIDDTDDIAADWLATEPEDDLARLIADGQQVTSDMASLLKGELKYQEGESLLKENDFSGAEQCFREAVKTHPDEAEYLIGLGWAIYKSKPNHAKAIQEAVELIRRAVELNPDLDNAHLLLGRIAQEESNPDLAQRHFYLALKANPDNDEAAFELAKMERPL